jgi:3-hydroxyacyl-CoA dehydrogenase
LLFQAVEKAESDFQGLVIGHDGKNFSAGLDLHIVLESARKKDWNHIERVLKEGQDCFMRVKQSKVPVVAAICGYTLGGGCELVLHCAAAQAYTDTNIGLVETNIGVIPAWGGTKESLIRAVERGGENADNVVQQVLATFRRLALAKKSANAEDAFAMGILSEPSRITINRERLLPDAKTLCLKLTRKYTPKTERIIEAPVGMLYQALEREVAALMQQEQPHMTPHREKTLKKLTATLSGHAALHGGGEVECSRPGWNKFSELTVMQTTREAFMELVQEEESLQKIEAVLG